MTIAQYLGPNTWIQIAAIITVAIFAVWGFSIFIGTLSRSNEIQKSICPEELLYVIDREEIKTIEDVVEIIHLASPIGRYIFDEGIKVNLKDIPLHRRKYLKIK